MSAANKAAMSASHALHASIASTAFNILLKAYTARQIVLIGGEASMISDINPVAIANMAETLKDRVMFTAPQGTKDRLKAWAESERRTISNLCEKVVLEALEQWEKDKAQQK